MIFKITKTNTGFVALISAIVISVILLLIATNLSLTGFYGRSDILDSELKDKSSALAEACADSAILKLLSDVNYVLTTADHAITVDTGQCDIYSYSSPRTGNITITTKANYNNKYFTTLRVVVDSNNNMSVASWEEI